MCKWAGICANSAADFSRADGPVEGHHAGGSALKVIGEDTPQKLNGPVAIAIGGVVIIEAGLKLDVVTDGRADAFHVHIHRARPERRPVLSRPGAGNSGSDSRAKRISAGSAAKQNVMPLPPMLVTGGTGTLGRLVVPGVEALPEEAGR